MKRNMCTLAFGMLLAGLAPNGAGLPLSAGNTTPDLAHAATTGGITLADAPWTPNATRFDLDTQAPARYGSEADLLAPEQTLAHAWHRAEVAAPPASPHPSPALMATVLPPVVGLPGPPWVFTTRLETLAAPGYLAEPTTLTLLALGLLCLVLREGLGRGEARATLIIDAPTGTKSPARARIPARADDKLPFFCVPITRQTRAASRRRAAAKSPVKQIPSSASRDSGKRSHDHKSTSALEKAAALRRARTSAATRPGAPKSARRGAPCPE